MKIIWTDNYNRDYISDFEDELFHHISPKEGAIVLKYLLDTRYPEEPWYPLLVADDYKPYTAMGWEES